MSTTPVDFLRLIQEDCFGAILAESSLATVAVILERKAVTEAEVKQRLGTELSRGGRIGACILVQRPTFFPDSGDSSLRGQIIQAFTVIEHPTLNAGSQGTGLSAELIAAELIRLFAFAARSRPEQVFSPYHAGALVPDNSFDGFNAWEARLQTFVSLGAACRCGIPLISPDSGAHPQTVTLTSATAGAAIYYTIDGSYPSSANSAAHLYSAPFSVPVACTLRVAAQKSDLQQSGIAEATFT